MNTTQLDKALAHGLARLGLGMAIALHGFVRLPDLSSFAAAMQKQFAETFLPGSLVYATGYCIAIGEAVIGTLLVLGLWLRPALAGGSLLMILLLTGTCLLQNWSVAGLQLGYLAFYAAVLASATCDRFSIDGVLRSRAANPQDNPKKCT
jgi:thiosulfate dehydrogenase [quinone] large subunit